MDGPKIKRLYYSTQEICELTNINDGALRRLEKKYDAFSPVKKGGRKKYTPADLKILKRILQYKDFGLTDNRIKIMLKNPHQADRLPTHPVLKTHRLIEEVKSTLYDILELIDASPQIPNN